MKAKLFFEMVSQNEACPERRVFTTTKLLGTLFFMVNIYNFVLIIDPQIDVPFVKDSIKLKFMLMPYACYYIWNISNLRVKMAMDRSMVPQFQPCYSIWSKIYIII